MPPNTLPSRTEQLADLYEMGALPPDVSQRYEEAALRGLVHDPAAARQAFRRQQTRIFQDAGARPPAPTPSPGMGRSFVQGAQDSILGTVRRIGTPQGMLAGVVDDASLIGGVVANHLGVNPATVRRYQQGASMVSNTLAPDYVAAGRNHLMNVTPQNFRERAAYIGGAVAPGLVVGSPETVLARLPAVMGGGVGAVAGQEITRAVGGSEQDQQLAAMIGGGLGGAAGVAGSGLRVRSGTVPAPDVNQLRAGRYVERQLPAPGSALDAPVNHLALQRQGATVAEQMGPRGRDALGTLATREGQTGGALEAEIATRQAERPTRIQATVGRHTGVDPAAAQGDIEAIMTAGRAKADPLFRAVRADATPISSTRLTQLTEMPVVQHALRQAYENLANNPDGPQAAAPIRQNPDGTITLEPTMAAYDQVYQALQQGVERNPITGRPIPDSQSPGNHNINQVRQAMRQELGRLSPGWNEAMTTAGEYMPLQAAYNDGGRLMFDRGTTEAQLAQRVARMSPADLQAFRGGIANEVFNRTQNGNFRPAALQTPRMQAKLAAALGPGPAAELTRALSSERAMQAFERRWGPGEGSRTGNIANAIAEQDQGSPMAGHIAQGVGDVMQHGSRGAIMRWIGSLAERGVAAAKTATMPVAVRDAAGEMLMRRDVTPAQLRAEIQQQRTAQAQSRPRIGYEPPPVLNGLLRGPRTARP